MEEIRDALRLINYAGRLWYVYVKCQYLNTRAIYLSPNASCYSPSRVS